MIDATKCKFKRNSQNYFKDSVVDIIDIEEELTKEYLIEKCQNKDFIYNNLLESSAITKNIDLRDYSFEFDNGKIKSFSEFYNVIEVLGEGTFGKVLSAADKMNRDELVAIKVLKLKVDNTKI